MRIHFSFSRRSTSTKSGIASAVFAMLFFSAFALGQAIFNGLGLQSTIGQKPIMADVQSVTFENRHATATVVPVGGTDALSIDLTNHPYEEIAHLANFKGELPILQTHTGTWEVYSGLDAIFILIFGAFTLLLCILVSSQFEFVKRPVCRLFFPLYLLCLILGTYLYLGVFQWYMLLIALPLLLAWGIHSMIERRKSSHVSSTTPPSTPSKRTTTIFLFIFGIIFVGAGLAVLAFTHHMTCASLTTLEDRREVRLTPHLSKTVRSSSGRHGSSTSAYVLASYPQADGTPYYVVLNDDDGLLLKKYHRDFNRFQFSRLYRFVPILGSVSLHDPNAVLPSVPKHKDHLLYDEQLSDLGVFHILRLFAMPFYLFGLFAMALACTPFLMKRGTYVVQLIHDQEKRLPQQNVALITKFMLPATILLAGYQWHTVYGRLPTLPLYSTLILFLPILICLILHLIQFVQIKRVGYYKVEFHTHEMGCCFSLTPPPKHPPRILINNVLMPVSNIAPNQWIIPSIDKHFEIHVEPHLVFYV